MSEGPSTSGGVRRGREEEEAPRRRSTRRRTGDRASGVVIRDVGEDVDGEVEDEIGAEVDAGIEAGRPNFPRGPRLDASFAEDWDGHDLTVASDLHVSARIKNGWPLGTMRTFSGYTKCLRVYETLPNSVNEILAGTAFGPLIVKWSEICRKKVQVKAHCGCIRHFMDHYWDSTISFHFRVLEAGINFSDFGMISGLPYGDRKMNFDIDPLRLGGKTVQELIGGGLKVPDTSQESFQVSMVAIAEYFAGGIGATTPEQIARLWLWWFLGAIFFGDKGERVNTFVLHYLADLGRLGEYDWVSPGLALFNKHCRAAVRPAKLRNGSSISLVGPGIIMEAWILSHFPFLLPESVVTPTTYPAVHGWAMMDRSRWNLDYDRTRRALNVFTRDQFVRRPWQDYTGAPEGLLERLQARDYARSYSDSPLGPSWFLFERLTFQTVPAPIVPHDPPSCVFLETTSAADRREKYGEGESDSLLLPDDYDVFVRTRLASGLFELFDPDMVHQPSDFPLDVEYMLGEDRHTFVLPEERRVAVLDQGMESWRDKICKVKAELYKKIWRTANRWRDVAAQKMAELCVYQQMVRDMQAVQGAEREQATAKEAAFRARVEAFDAREAEFEARVVLEGLSHSL